ncbi:hypothetical protein KIN20_035134 [Parelaphostrongylus tenuis]|uniref:Uncharacterized protein n=1 Tax=Parelaphostrongylus tenuis TaxID=148309 RepID=A0AAD5RAR1_PARTN|nr:hypothetical protein KIN20_035134 [Parelaphostrongylus tenuis]
MSLTLHHKLKNGASRQLFSFALNGFACLVHKSSNFRMGSGASSGAKDFITLVNVLER